MLLLYFAKFQQLLYVSQGELSQLIQNFNKMSTEEINTTSLSNESQKDLLLSLMKIFWINGDLKLRTRQVHEKISTLDFGVMIRQARIFRTLVFCKVDSGGFGFYEGLASWNSISLWQVSASMEGNFEKYSL
ncbi:hypothetical protein GLOIN_2v1876553 [Rhizophagus irregularis DAOM 181602=DAOM 197198]|uniref:Uncharacterized protein n=1 Tax=Rhizophagus irregularis (strain DAOM 181602 / DAOM 197198 / MUCL 43194) TaxID=747089 RepID=A0A2P4PYZ3_RHIID|nr:hypothetical protein GLOIN_2v1876553 [Rhizophagus irregularis DAOM 181602=DAOM 197198]POG70615.1 hypothetical protein GLOIN_2v1876553 [Rhizophagus irregularis DAOM 181602=DAOM 197198]|eukprot:XP_025177481.1 hypothetical protein GLOIN_2v1876553 [Rhizophagus irregularis DAOM 181602=DAOM 197198]